MCTGALIHARVRRLVFGAREPRAGAVVSRLQLPDQEWLNHRLQWQGDVLAAESAALLQQFSAPVEAEPRPRGATVAGQPGELFQYNAARLFAACGESPRC